MEEIFVIQKKLARGFIILLVCVLALSAGACSGGSSGNSPEKPVENSQTPSASESAGASPGAASREAASGEAAKLAEAELGPKEITNMIPADGKKPDPPQPLPENPPKGIEVYPATTNVTTGKPIEYARSEAPPTNGKHDPLWQNCGYYPREINDRHAVHSLDHGVVWITYQPDLPQRQVNELRDYARREYTIVSPYPGQSAPVTATSWRVQLELRSATDPRLRQFVDQFRNSEIAPLSGNRCELGVGNPEVRPG